MFLSKLFQIGKESDSINGLVVDLTEAHAVFFCHRRDHCTVPYVNILLINREVRVLGRILAHDQ